MFACNYKKFLVVRYLFHESIYSMKYESENSFGDTYGDHREFLELKHEDFIQLSKCCKKNNVDFIITPFDLESLQRCINLKVDACRYHEGGKLAIVPVTPLATQNDLSLAYTPGVTEPVKAIADDPKLAYR